MKEEGKEDSISFLEKFFKKKRKIQPQLKRQRKEKKRGDKRKLS